MTDIFRFSPISNITFSSISRIKDRNQKYKVQDAFTRESINSKLKEKPDNIYENDNRDSDNQINKKNEFSNPNIAVIKLLEEKRKELKKDIEMISTQLKRHIRQVEYIESRIYELKGETSEFQINKLELDSCQINSSRLSTTINTGINSPISELANSNDPGYKYYLSYQTDGDWTLIPEFKDLVKMFN